MDDGRMSADEQMDVEETYSEMSLEELLQTPEVEDCSSCVVGG